MSIELRLSDVEPPAAEPKRTIYRDVLNLPSPVQLGLTVRYFNYDDVGLYMQVTGSGTGYTFGTVNLGLLASGASAYKNLDNFASRAKPSAGEFTLGEFEEVVTLILKAYTDAGYSNLKWTFEKTVTVHWIKSDDAAFTQDVLNNFDDGTVQGWAAANEAGNQGGYPVIQVATDLVLSTPNSLRVYGMRASSPVRYRVYKSFTTPNKDIVYAIIDIRVTTAIEEGAVVDGNYMKNLRTQRNGTVVIFLGRPYIDDTVSYIPKGKWIREVVPLPKNVTFELRIVYEYGSDYVDARSWGGMRMDDFKIISK